MKRLIACVMLASLSALVWALPTLQQVEAQVRQGNYAQAESMMREVVAAKPDSARAHYVYAEILAHDGKLAQAVEEAKAARTIDPDVKFTDPEKFRTFEAALLRAQNPTARTPPAPVETRAPAQAAHERVAPAPASTGVPGWMWLVGLGVIGFFLWRMLSRSRAASMASGAAVPGAGYAAPMQQGPGMAGGPYGVGAPGATGAPYGPGYPAQRPGSGMLGVGLGAAGGVAAGMLAERLLNSRREAGHDPTTLPGFFDSPQGGGAADDLDNRPIDFGTGGNDWDAGSGDVGGADFGGGGDGGGGWD